MAMVAGINIAAPPPAARAVSLPPAASPSWVDSLPSPRIQTVSAVRPTYLGFRGAEGNPTIHPASSKPPELTSLTISVQSKGRAKRLRNADAAAAFGERYRSRGQIGRRGSGNW